MRELGHAIEAALILGGPDGFAEALAGALAGRSEPNGAEGSTEANEPPATAPARYSFYGSGDEERERIRGALGRCRGNRTRAAIELGMTRNTLRDRMRRYGL